MKRQVIEDHPHPDKMHLVRTYRRYILYIKKKNGSARSLVHYHDYVAIYRKAKRISMSHEWYSHPDGDTVCRKCHRVKDLERSSLCDWREQ